MSNVDTTTNVGLSALQADTATLVEKLNRILKVSPEDISDDMVAQLKSSVDAALLGLSEVIFFTEDEQKVTCIDHKEILDRLTKSSNTILGLVECARMSGKKILQSRTRRSFVYWMTSRRRLFDCETYWFMLPRNPLTYR